MTFSFCSFSFVGKGVVEAEEEICFCGVDVDGFVKAARVDESKFRLEKVVEDAVLEVDVGLS